MINTNGKDNTGLSEISRESEEIKEDDSPGGWFKRWNQLYKKFTLTVKINDRTSKI